MLAHLTVIALAIAPSQHVHPAPADTAVRPRIRVDSVRKEVVITVGPVALKSQPGSGPHVGDSHATFVWPVGGWVRGYRIDVIDNAGRALPSELVHHAGLANLDRRQLAYPAAERLLAVGKETTPVSLPPSLGAPLDSGTTLALYYALHNQTKSDVPAASLRLTLLWTPPGSRRPPKIVLPIVLDANPGLGLTSAFDLPPGKSTKSSEFTLPTSGYAYGLGGHVHDYAVAVSVEDVQTGKVLVRLPTQRDSAGKVISVGRKRFVWLFNWKGLRLEANRRYRVVGEYDNPTCEVIKAGGMASVAGPFAPDDYRKWPRVDPNNPFFRRDVASLQTASASGGMSGHPASHHEAGSSPSTNGASNGATNGRASGANGSAASAVPTGRGGRSCAISATR